MVLVTGGTGSCFSDPGFTCQQCTGNQLNSGVKVGSKLTMLL